MNTWTSVFIANKNLHSGIAKEAIDPESDRAPVSEMIWESITLMTLIDFAIIGVAIVSIWVLIQHRKRFKKYGRPAGIVYVVIGLGAIGLLYAADLITMWILPLFISQQAAMSYMNALHDT